MQSEDKFINMLKQNDQNAYNELYQKYTSKIISVLRNYVRQSELEDALQEVFVRIFKGIHNFKGKSKLSTWIYKISINVGKNYLKKYVNDNIEIMDLENNNDKKTYFYQPISSTNISEKNISDLNYELILNLIDKMNPDEKTIITLRDVEKMSYKEVAHIMNIPIGTVKSKLYYARKKLKKLMLKENF